MTANEDMLGPLDALAWRWAHTDGPTRAEQQAVIAELDKLRQFRDITLNEARNRRSRTSIGPDSERIRELEAEVEKYKSALDEIDRMNPDDFRTGQGHLSPAFREVNFRAAFAHVCRIVNRTLHGIDSTEGPRR